MLAAYHKGEEDQVGTVLKQDQVALNWFRSIYPMDATRSEFQAANPDLAWAPMSFNRALVNLKALRLIRATGKREGEFKAKQTTFVAREDRFALTLAEAREQLFVRRCETCLQPIGLGNEEEDDS